MENEKGNTTIIAILVVVVMIVVAVVAYQQGVFGGKDNSGGVKVQVPGNSGGSGY